MIRNFEGTDPFIWWYGVVEDRKDPLFLGRVKVRIRGWHSDNKEEMPTDTLPWAYPIIALDNGNNTIGLKERDWVVGFFRDSVIRQQPVIMGVLPGIPEQPSNPDLGFNDPTPEEELSPTKVPRPPEMSAPPVSSQMVKSLGLMDLLGKIGLSAETLKSLGDNQLTQAGSIISNLSNVTNLTTATNLIKSFGDVANTLSIVPGAGDGLEGEIQRTIQRNIDKVTATISGLIPSDITDLVTMASSLSQFNKIPNFTDIATVAQGISGISGKELKSFTSVQKILSKVKISELPDNIKETIKTEFGDISDFSTMSSSLDKLSTNFSGLSQGAQLTSLTQAGGFLNSFANNNVNDIVAVGSILNNVASALTSGNIDQVAAQISNIKNIGQNAINVINSTAESILSIKDVIDPQIIDKALTAITEQLPDLSDLTDFTGLKNLIATNGDFTLSGVVSDISTTLLGEDLTDIGETLSKYKDPNNLPGDTTSFGELIKDYVPTEYKFDVNKDGKYDSTDANIISFDANNDGVVSPKEDKFVGDGGVEVGTVPISRYPLEDRLKEPNTARLARGEGGDGKIEKTIVARKKGELALGESAGHEAAGTGTDNVGVEGEVFNEPTTPYDAVYPYNHVYESESGHVIEIDDTPGVERLHRYHRAGTFEEIHPDGTQVNKIKKAHYHFVIEDYFVGVEKSINITSGEAFRMKSGKEMNINAGENLNRDVGKDLNTLVKGYANTKIEKNSYTVIKGDLRLLVEGNLFVASEGDMMFKAKGDFLVDAKNIKTNAAALNTVSAGAAVITEGPLTYTNTPLTDGIFINAKTAQYAATAGELVVVPIPIPSLTVPGTFTKENTADNKDNVTDSSTPKEGYILDPGVTGDLYKPVSDSSGKLVILTKGLGGAIYQAIPTGTLEEVTIQYKSKDGTITSWPVIRPVHKKGELIESGVFAGNGNGGRNHYRFQKPGGEYPAQMVAVIGGTEYLIVESLARHEAF